MTEACGIFFYCWGFFCLKWGRKDEAICSHLPGISCPSCFPSGCVSVGMGPPYSNRGFKLLFRWIQQINTFHCWKLSFCSQNYAETRNTSKFWVSCFSVFYVAGVYFFFLSSTCFGAAFKSLLSLSRSISLTCLNYSLIKSKILFRKRSSGHVCAGSQPANGTPRRHCAGHGRSCLGTLGKKLRRCTLGLFPIRLGSCALSWMAHLNMSEL